VSYTTDVIQTASFSPEGHRYRAPVALFFGSEEKQNLETQRDVATTKTLHRRDRSGRRDAQEKQRQELDFRAKIVAGREDFYD